jgi:hypothetical protein
MQSLVIVCVTGVIDMYRRSGTSVLIVKSLRGKRKREMRMGQKGAGPFVTLVVLL